MEVEDDAFFADISKQISLLIMDDEDEKVVAHCPSVTLQAFSRAVHPSSQLSPYTNDQSCRGESKGTGVFIPRSSPPRRKNRNGRFITTSSANTKYQRQPENSRGLPQVSYNNNSKR